MVAPFCGVVAVRIINIRKNTISLLKVFARPITALVQSGAIIKLDGGGKGGGIARLDCYGFYKPARIVAYAAAPGGLPFVSRRDWLLPLQKRHTRGCLFVWTGAVSDDLPVKKIHQNTYVVPFVVDPDIGQIADDSGILALPVKLPVQFIRYRGLVAFDGMYLKTAF